MPIIGERIIGKGLQLTDQVEFVYVGYAKRAGERRCIRSERETETSGEIKNMYSQISVKETRVLNEIICGDKWKNISEIVYDKTCLTSS